MASTRSHASKTNYTCASAYLGTYLRTLGTPPHASTHTHTHHTHQLHPSKATHAKCAHNEQVLLVHAVELCQVIVFWSAPQRSERTRGGGDREMGAWEGEGEGKRRKNGRGGRWRGRGGRGRDDGKNFGKIRSERVRMYIEYARG